ncbi:MAG: MFS transporter [Chlamydiae bacterium]|nr:MFS transporter [Chlamydiota bacterium]
MKKWLVCLSAALFFAYELVQMHMMNSISTMLMRDLHLNATSFGLVSATYLLADVIFLLPAGIILDRYSTRKVILTALFFCILGTLGFGFANSLWFACICHFLSGIGNAFCFLSCMMLVSRWFPREKQAFVVGLMVTIGMLGAVIAQAPFSSLAKIFDWRGALFIDAGIGFGILGLIYAFVKDAPADEIIREKLANAPFWSLVRSSLFNLQNISCGLYTGLMNLPLMIISAVWGSLFLMQVHYIPSETAAFIVSMICMGTIVGSPLFGWISDKMGKRRLPMLLGALSSFVVMMLIIMLPHPSQAILTVLFFLLGLTTSTQVLGYPMITENNPKELTGTSMGVAAVIIMGLAAFIQPLSGKLIDWHWDGKMAGGIPIYSVSDFHTAFMIFPLAFLLSFLLIFLIKESKLAKIRV